MNIPLPLPQQNQLAKLEPFPGEHPQQHDPLPCSQQWLLTLKLFLTRGHTASEHGLGVCEQLFRFTVSPPKILDHFGLKLFPVTTFGYSQSF